METKRAELKVGVITYPVIVEDTIGTESVRVKIDWTQVTKFFGATPNLKQIFNCFISDIGFDNDYWNYPEHALNTLYVEPEWLILDEPEEGEAIVQPKAGLIDHYKLTRVASRKMDEFPSEGYTIVRVEDTMDMNEGTITLHYKKEEA